MAIVITNGQHFVFHSEKNGIKMTKDIKSAFVFPSVKDAIRDMKKAPVKTKKYYVFDTLENKILWRWLTDEEKIQRVEVKRDKYGRIKRKQYSESTRKMLYNNADGRCQLCGRKILYSDASIDHIIPLAMDGEDCVNNLQIACVPCNRYKDNILPEEYIDRITTAFVFQMGKKYKRSLKWKIVHSLIKKMI